MPRHIYAASHCEHGSVQHFILSDKGELSLQHRYDMSSSVDFLTVSGNRVHVLLREPFRGQSGVVSFAIQKDGSLIKQGDPVPTRGSIASYVLEYHDALYVTNYIQGTTIRLPDTMIVHMGHGADPVRQICSHPHCIVPIPQTDLLCIADLGTDSLIVVRPELKTVSQAWLRPGVGPRHVSFSSDGKTGYCVTEMGNTVVVLTQENGILIPVGEYATLPEGETVQSTAAAIRLDESQGFLYVSNRGHESICRYRLVGKRLTDPIWIRSMGCSPRDFQLAGAYLLCANEKSNKIVSICLNKHTPQVVSEIEIPGPWAIGLGQRFPGNFE